MKTSGQQQPYVSEPIGVLGAGSWGTALAFLLANNNQPVRLWGHIPEKLQHYAQEKQNTDYLPGFIFPETLVIETDLSTVLQDCQDILIVVPSHAFRQTLGKIQPFITTEHRLCWATKGLDPSTNQLLSEVVSEFYDSIAMAALSGPSFAKEVVKKIPTIITLASNNTQFSQDLCRRFRAPYFRLYETDDLIGTQLGGAIKNVLAIATGISDGLALGANTRSALITRGLAEIMRLGKALGAQSETLMGPAGLGDLILTCTDNQSRNRRFGFALGQGKTITEAKIEIGQVVEGLDNAKQTYQMAQQLSIDMPICEHVYLITENKISIEKAIEALITR